ncbi:hypothetical protein I5L59_02010 [Pseudomonas moraviensis]|uniref:SLOG domain-containing protein n=1 Tax=Pseudomonas moraviensis TaxID=321662 RepID=UPI0018D7BA32|nr:hypothetical protein [Pseudomonas moraviensis]MBH3442353.1 hypothetical protein [Pseudomonas moraviensis]
MKKSIFLSASVPTRGRAFFGDCHPYQIQMAVRSLLLLVLGRRRIVFGGHPSITPMVYAAGRNFKLQSIECATVYQSAYFEDKFPLENQGFADIRLIAKEETLKDSVLSMRDRMMEDNEFQAGIFIGGMEGVIEEYKLFTSKFPKAKIIAVRAGGGATATLPSTHTDHRLKDLEKSRDYFSLYTSILGIEPDSERNFGN